MIGLLPTELMYKPPVADDAPRLLSLTIEQLKAITEGLNVRQAFAERGMFASEQSLAHFTLQTTPHVTPWWLLLDNAYS